jgi:glycosyltransferase involved in cell wall biosynthesis
MKVLYAIAEHYPTFRADVNILFGKYLARQGIQTDLLTLHTSPGVPPPWPGGSLHTLAGSTKRFTKHLRSIGNDMRLLRLAGNGYDAVQVRDKALCALIGLLAARIHRVPFYYWMSFLTAEAWSSFAKDRGLSVGWLRWGLAWMRGRAMHLMMYRIILRRADHVFVQSDRMHAYLVRKGIPPERMTAIPMGIDNEAVTRSAEKERSESISPYPTFVYLGSLNRNRSPEVMIDAIDLVRSQVPDIRLLLIGEPDEPEDAAWLQSLIDERQLSDCVRVTGWLPMEEGWTLAKRCLAGLSPIPRTELLDVGSPTKAVEYFGLGLPVIANDQPDQQQVLAAAGGRCVPFTARGFADGMLDVIADPDRYRNQAEAGRRWVTSQRSYAELATRVARVYRRSVKGAAGDWVPE